MNLKVLKIATRGSKLALAQTQLVANEISSIVPQLDIQIIEIQTKGDKVLDTALSKIGDKGLFTKEIEEALFDKRAHIAVHSLKDLSTEIPEGLKLAAVLERGEVRDVLIHKTGKKLHELTADDVIATSSLRRKAGLSAQNNRVKIIDIRGNVNTRLRKMEEGHCDGMIMAAAGLIRLGLEKYITQYIAADVILPAVGQGAIAIECRNDDTEILEILAQLNHLQTFRCITAERAFMQKLQGGCQVPVGAYSQINGDNIILNGFVSSVNGTNFILESASGPVSNAYEIGIALANKIILKGGDKILNEIRTAK